MSNHGVYVSDSAPDNLDSSSSFQLFTSPARATLPTTSALDSIPPLKTELTTSTSAKIDALKLIADSIAQQRQIASYSLITHPITLSIYALLVATLARYLYKTSSDLGILVTTVAGISMACLIAVRGACSGYISAAEEINLSYLDSQGDGGEELLITSTFGTEIIGALVLHLQPKIFKASPPSSPSKKSRKSHHGNHHKGGKSLIRAWTTSLRYRKKGIGSALLEEAVKITRERLGRDAEIGFSVSHANSLRVLPQIFNGRITRGEYQAAKLLEDVVAKEMDGRKRR